MKTFLKILKSAGLIILLIIITVLLMIFFAFALSQITVTFFAPKNYLFFSMGLERTLIFVLEILVVFTIIVWYKTEIEKKNFFANNIYKSIKKHKLLSTFVVVFTCYIIVSSTTVVTGNKIITRNFLNPVGNSHTYDDVVAIETGFYGYDPIIGAGEGDFYYKIKLGDGKWIDLGSNISNSKIENGDTWATIEYVDKAFVKSGAIKISSDKFSDIYGYDKDVLARFKRIISNK
jgi:hypothetical protein